MKIRTRLSLQFALITASILIVSLYAIYFFSARYREDQFYDRLMQRARTTAKLLIEVSEVDHDLLKIIDRNTLSLPAESILIFDHHNDEIYNSQDTLAEVVDPSLLDEIRLQEEVRFRQEKREYLGILYTDTYNRFVVIASASDIYGLGKLHNLRMVLIAVFGASMTFILAGGWWLSGEALRPMAHVVGQVDQISAINLDARVAEGKGEDEITQLAKTFNRMLDRVETAFHAQRNFVSHASHELRTPLTALTGQIEVCLLRARTPAAYQQVLHSLLEDITHLTRLSNGLLELAQLNPETNPMAMTSFRLDEILWQSRQEVLHRRAGSSIQVMFENFPDEEQQLLVFGSEHLLKSALVNLMDNACKFSAPHPVDVKVSFTPQATTVIISDRGIGMSPGDLQHIWEPFYRAANARTYQGHGLGLSLTHKILQLHQITAEIHSQLREGTQVTLHIPSRMKENQAA